jgi:hypothetical protein
MLFMGAMVEMGTRVMFIRFCGFLFAGFLSHNQIHSILNVGARKVILDVLTTCLVWTMAWHPTRLSLSSAHIQDTKSSTVQYSHCGSARYWDNENDNTEPLRSSITSATATATEVVVEL